MANTKALSKEERKKAKRTARKKASAQEAPRICAWLQEAQDEEDGTRHSQALGAFW